MHANDESTSAVIPSTGQRLSQQDAPMVWFHLTTDHGTSSCRVPDYTANRMITELSEDRRHWTSTRQFTITVTEA